MPLGGVGGRACIQREAGGAVVGGVSQETLWAERMHVCGGRLSQELVEVIGRGKEAGGGEVCV